MAHAIHASAENATHAGSIGFTELVCGWMYVAADQSLQMWNLVFANLPEARSNQVPSLCNLS